MVMWWCHFLSREGGLGGDEAGLDVGGFAIVENGNYYSSLRFGRLPDMAGKDDVVLGRSNYVAEVRS